LASLTKQQINTTTALVRLLHLESARRRFAFGAHFPCTKKKTSQGVRILLFDFSQTFTFRKIFRYFCFRLVYFQSDGRRDRACKLHKMRWNIVAPSGFNPRWKL
jgi:hypothetical protein